MPEERGELREINYRQLLPWTELFRAFHVALDFRKLLLAGAAILVMYLGWWGLALVFGSSSEPKLADYPVEKYDNDKAKAERAYRKSKFLYDATTEFKHCPWNENRGKNPYLVVTQTPDDLLTPNFWATQTPVLLEPLTKFIRPITMLLDPDAGFFSYLFCILGILWTLATWAIFGGAITRIAAVQIARKEKIGMIEALKFAWSKYLSYFSAPLFPVGVVAVITLVMVIVGGIILLIPYGGELLAGLLWVLPLLGGLIMVALLVGYVAWPLMHATISTEGSDSFDALSRSYSYLYQRPWHYLFYVLVALVYGVLVTFFVVFATSFFVYMASWAMGLVVWAGYYSDVNSVQAMGVYAPSSYGWRDLLLGGQSAETLRDQMNWGQKAGAGLVAFWLGLIFLLMLGFAYSYFWSASTIIYFLLRKNVDDTDLEEVYFEEEDEEVYTMPPTAAPLATTAPAATSSPATLPMVEPPRAPTTTLAPAQDQPGGDGGNDAKDKPP